MLLWSHRRLLSTPTSLLLHNAPGEVLQRNSSLWSARIALTSMCPFRSSWSIEEVLLRYQSELGLTQEDVVDALCALSKHHKSYFLWRPYLRDRKDELVLELAVAARCNYIVTYNQRDFGGAETLGIRVMDPRTFLQEIGELT